MCDSIDCCWTNNIYVHINSPINSRSQIWMFDLYGFRTLPILPLYHCVDSWVSTEIFILLRSSKWYLFGPVQDQQLSSKIYSSLLLLLMTRYKSGYSAQLNKSINLPSCLLIHQGRTSLSQKILSVNLIWLVIAGVHDWV